MISAVYAVISALLIAYLGFKVARLRIKYKVRLGHGNIDALEYAIRVHGNAVEYLLIALLLLFFFGI